MPGMQLQQGLQGERAACCPEGARKGLHAARVGRGPPLLPGSPSSQAAQGSGGTELFPGLASPQKWQAGNLLFPRQGTPGGRDRLLCASTSSHLCSHNLRQLFKEMSTQTSELVAPGMASEPGRWRMGFQPAVASGEGSED